VQFFVNGAVFASFMPRLPEIRDRVGISIAEIGLLVSLAGLCGLLGSAAVGPAINRTTSRRVLIMAGMLVPLFLIVVGVAPNVWWLAVGLIGMMTFDVPVDVAMNLQGSRLSARRPTPIINRLHGLWSLGTLVGGLTSSRFAASDLPLAVHLVSAAVVLLATMLYVAPGLLTTDVEPVEDEPATDAEDPVSSGDSQRANDPGAHRSVVALGRGTAGLFMLAGLFSVALEATSLDWASFRLADDFDASPALAALGYTAVAGGMTLARLSGDAAVVRFGRDGHALGSLALTAAGLCLAVLGPSPAFSLVGFALTGMGNAALMPLLYDRAAQAPGPTGAGLGALTAGIRLALLTVPLAVGTLAATSLSVAQAIAIVCGPSVVGFYLVSRPIRQAVRASAPVSGDARS
jgi:MFS family permease